MTDLIHWFPSVLEVSPKFLLISFHHSIYHQNVLNIIGMKLPVDVTTYISRTCKGTTYFLIQIKYYALCNYIQYKIINHQNNFVKFWQLSNF